MQGKLPQRLLSGNRQRRGTLREPAPLQFFLGTERADQHGLFPDPGRLRPAACLTARHFQRCVRPVLPERGAIPDAQDHRGHPAADPGHQQPGGGSSGPAHRPGGKPLRPGVRCLAAAHLPGESALRTKAPVGSGRGGGELRPGLGGGKAAGTSLPATKSQSVTSAAHSVPKGVPAAEAVEQAESAFSPLPNGMRGGGDVFTLSLRLCVCGILPVHAHTNRPQSPRPAGTGASIHLSWSGHRLFYIGKPGPLDTRSPAGTGAAPRRGVRFRVLVGKCHHPDRSCGHLLPGAE